MLSITTRYLLPVAMILTLSACGSGLPAALPDDPTNEPVAVNPGTGDNNSSQGGGSADLPSTTPEEPAVGAPVTEREQTLKLYDYLDPSHIVPTKGLEEAVLYFHKNKSSFKNTSVISVLDFSQSSTKKRWYFIDMKTGSVWNIHVAHGKGSDSDHDGYAESFSNVSGSNASSLGFYKTAETYSGSHGYSLRLDGLSSTNSNVRDRAIVVHGADYVQESNVIQGRSWGCPAVAQENRDKVINMIKGGSLIFAFR